MEKPGLYTEGLESLVFSYQAEDEYDIESVRAFMNGSDFRTFGERLLAFVNTATGSDFESDTNNAANELNKRLKTHGADIAVNTLKNWFSGKTEPKLGDNDRENMFKIAFALELDVEGTEEFFKKVMLDRAFNIRNPHEMIYRYCLSNGKSYEIARSMIERLGLSLPTDSDDTVVGTEIMKQESAVLKRENDIVEYILKHPHNFALNNTKAHETADRLLASIKGSDDTTGLAYEEFLQDSFDEDGRTGGRDVSSTDYALLQITGRDFVKKAKDELTVKDLFKRREIYNQWPDKISIGLKDASSYTLRKELIFLKFYEFFVRINLHRIDVEPCDRYDTFIEEMNDILNECGYSALYAGNPYDWLFLFCASTDDPIETFRMLLE